MRELKSVAEYTEACQRDANRRGVEMTTNLELGDSRIFP
jgi:hypothetical protein